MPAVHEMERNAFRLIEVPKPERLTTINTLIMNKNGNARWAAIVGDVVIPMPRRIVTALLIKEQAGRGSDVTLIRDFQSPFDEEFRDEAEIDLAQGNVFRSKVGHCGGNHHEADCPPPKLAFILDDRFEIVVGSKQSEASLRRLFGVQDKVQLLRDRESQFDEPIGEGESIEFSDGPVFLSCVDLEKHCSDGSHPPHSSRYLIRVDKTRILVDTPDPTGREILILAGKDPAATMLNQKIGKAFTPVGLAQKVDLTACGVERFTTLPNEQSEGGVP